MKTTIEARDGHKFDAYVAGPEQSTRGLVVVQEIFGVNSHMRQISDRFAEQGYRVICPALFDRAERGVELGYTGEDVQRGLGLRSQIEDSQTLMDIEAAAAALGDSIKLGIVGYCWGGTLSWLAACRSQAFSAASCWYGGGIAGLKDETPRIPVQMHFGSLDKSIPEADVKAIQAAQPDVAVYVYEGADHGFGCDQRAAFDSASNALAQNRTLEFFKTHLG